MTGQDKHTGARKGRARKALVGTTVSSGCRKSGH